MPVTLSRGKQCALAALVLLAIGSAMVFRRTTAQTLPQHATGDGSSHIALTRRLPPGGGERGQVLQSFEETLPRLPATATADPDAAGREFTAHPDRTFHPASGLFERSAALEPTDSRDFEAPAEGAGEVFAESSQPRTHTVIDGDTLARLAARYLGSSDRYGEIFAANRGVLSTPDLLPIGVELVIPPRQRPAPPAAMTAEDQDAPGVEEQAAPRLEVEMAVEEDAGAESGAAASRAAEESGSSEANRAPEDEDALVPVPKAAPTSGN
jgi:phage tail protein X